MPTISNDNTYYVDLGDDPDFGAATFISAYPENCSFSDQIRGVGDIGFQLSYSATDQDGDIVVTSPASPGNVPFIGPYRSYYRLRYGNTIIMSGVITQVGTNLGDDFMSVAGKTWEHFLEKWQYPFDPRTTERTPGVPLSAPINDFVNTNSTPVPMKEGGIVYQVANRDIIYILRDLWEYIADGSGTTPVYDRLPIDITSLNSASGIEALHYQFGLGDMTYLSSIVDDLSTVGYGFDWWVSWDKKFTWASPFRYGNPSSPSYITTIDDTTPPLELTFQNTGPVATHVTGRGAGLGTTQLASAYSYVQARQQFTRLDADFDLGDVKNRSALNMKTQRQLSRAVQPQHAITISFDPSTISGFWANWRKGRAIYLNYDLGYHIIDSGQQLKSYQANIDLNGNCVITFTLDQIYELSVNWGTAEG